MIDFFLIRQISSSQLAMFSHNLPVQSRSYWFWLSFRYFFFFVKIILLSCVNKMCWIPTAKFGGKRKIDRKRRLNQKRTVVGSERILVLNSENAKVCLCYLSSDHIVSRDSAYVSHSHSVLCFIVAGFALSHLRNFQTCLTLQSC